ncbi:MAG: hypothetical protein ACREXX_08285 [Gammaproteobacteria bacterium]
MRARRGKRDAARFDTEERCERRDALVKQFERRGAQPCQYQLLVPAGRGVGGQDDDGLR